MGHVILLILRQCHPLRSYRIFKFLVTVFLLFRRRDRWLIWQPLPPEELVATVRTLGTSFLKLAQVLATRAWRRVRSCVATFLSQTPRDLLSNNAVQHDLQSL